MPVHGRIAWDEKLAWHDKDSAVPVPSTWGERLISSSASTEDVYQDMSSELPVMRGWPDLL
jgi:hypothetical protein